MNLYFFKVKMRKKKLELRKAELDIRKQEAEEKRQSNWRFQQVILQQKRSAQMI